MKPASHKAGSCSPVSSITASCLPAYLPPGCSCCASLQVISTPAHFYSAWCCEAFAWLESKGPEYPCQISTNQ